MTPELVRESLRDAWGDLAADAAVAETIATLVGTLEAYQAEILRGNAELDDDAVTRARARVDELVAAGESLAYLSGGRARAAVVATVARIVVRAAEGSARDRALDRAAERARERAWAAEREREHELAAERERELTAERDRARASAGPTEASPPYYLARHLARFLLARFARRHPRGEEAMVLYVAGLEDPLEALLSTWTVAAAGKALGVDPELAQQAVEQQSRALFDVCVERFHAFNDAAVLRAVAEARERGDAPIFL